MTEIPKLRRRIEAVEKTEEPDEDIVIKIVRVISDGKGESKSYVREVRIKKDK